MSVEPAGRDARSRLMSHGKETQKRNDERVLITTTNNSMNETKSTDVESC
jgi:hypothetical protein